VKKKVKAFSYHWGSGIVAEEAQVKGPHHVPTIQLLSYTEGEAAGNVSIRFCHYGHDGRFRRSPLLMSPDEIDMMRDALRETPRLREALRKLVEE
jgi:hypothetical protein